MNLEIIGAESLGVRSLCCLVTLPDRRIVIDPGVSLGYVRNGLLPHPLEAERALLYEEMPVPHGWHEDYAKGRVDPEEYIDAIHYHGAWF